EDHSGSAAHSRGEIASRPVGREFVDRAVDIACGKEISSTVESKSSCTHQAGSEAARHSRRGDLGNPAAQVRYEEVAILVKRQTGWISQAGSESALSSSGSYS
ncbi:MAG: hypothetical protein ABI233_02700, partial [Chthoniobacterales bacterium]